MEAEGLERIYVDLPGEQVEITREERDLLLEELCFVAGSRSIREAFEAARPSQAVELTSEERRRLRADLANLEADVALPDGIVRLLAALERVPGSDVSSGLRRA